ncbi:MAG: hypothetical protein LPK92_01340 [Actinomycetes bacterium]|nr:hypothetical protein [Actinomycetes bacterium]
MAARIEEHGTEAVHRVIRWYWRSYHPRAVFLREHGSVLTTLVRPDNFVAYLEMAEGDRMAEPRPKPAKVVELTPELRDRLEEARRKHVQSMFGGVLGKGRTDA